MVGRRNSYCWKWWCVFRLLYNLEAQKGFIMVRWIFVTSADVKFTADYCMDPDGGCAQLNKFDGIKSIETPDDRTIVITTKSPKPNPYGPFMGGQHILQKAQFENCTGAKASQCTEQFYPLV